ncbi:hypothetical protein HPB50_013380 [Hyalomma asiaticum]|uniref:Uncharacterized protein n=1 Tax=Hyalomma asiaticum TaxID=266040 RepID=A0ACB7SMB3_HYAAI|nr:hypothetical protein HPB50_013380 [Hyalomma asiaticum]
MFGIAGLQYIARGHSVSSEYPLTFEQMGHGIVSNVTLDKNVLTNWTMKPIPLANASWLTDYDELRSIRKQVSSKAVSSPYEVRVLAAKFELPSSGPYDTFLRPDQKTKNLLVLIELEGAFHRAGKPPVVHFENKPELDGKAHRMDE